MDVCSRITTARLRPGARILLTAQGAGVELPRVIHPGLRAARVLAVEPVLGERRRRIVTDLGAVTATPSQEHTVACGEPGCHAVAVDGDPANTGQDGQCVEHGGIPRHVRTLPECNRARVEANGLEPWPYPAGWELWGALNDPYAPAWPAPAEPAAERVTDDAGELVMVLADAPAPRRVELARPVQLRTGDAPDPDECGTGLLDTDRPDVVVIPCGGAKLGRPAPAGELYVGSYHAATRRAADALRPGRVLILSALHGLVPLDVELAPYELRMGQPGSVTPARLAEQAARLGVAGARVVALAGAAYVEPLRTVWPDLEAPLAGTRGIGEQLARLAQVSRTGELCR